MGDSRITHRDAVPGGTNDDRRTKDAHLTLLGNEACENTGTKGKADSNERGVRVSTRDVEAGRADILMRTTESALFLPRRVGYSPSVWPAL